MGLRAGRMKRSGGQDDQGRRVHKGKKRKEEDVRGGILANERRGRKEEKNERKGLMVMYWSVAAHSQEVKRRQSPARSSVFLSCS